MSDKISGTLHPIPCIIANQWWTSIRNIIIYLETKFRPNRRIFVFGGHFIPWLPWQWPPFWFFSTPLKAATYYGGHSYKVDNNMAPKPWISIPNIKIYLETKFRPNRRIFVFLAIGNQRWISIRNIIIYLKTKFCPNQRIFVFGGHANGRHFEFFKPPKAATHYCGYSYKVSWSLMKGIQTNYKSPLFYFHGNCGKVCPTDSDFFGLSCSTRCGCCSYQVSSISVQRVTCCDHFCVFFLF